MEVNIIDVKKTLEEDRLKAYRQIGETLCLNANDWRLEDSTYENVPGDAKEQSQHINNILTDCNSKMRRPKLFGSVRLLEDYISIEENISCIF